MSLTPLQLPQSMNISKILDDLGIRAMNIEEQVQKQLTEQIFSSVEAMLDNKIAVIVNALHQKQDKIEEISDLRLNNLQNNILSLSHTLTRYFQPRTSVHGNVNKELIQLSNSLVNTGDNS